MDNLLFKNFLLKIINNEDIRDRNSNIKLDLDQSELKLINSLSSEQLKLFDEYKFNVNAHYILVRNDDCERVFSLAMNLCHLVKTKLEIMETEERETMLKRTYEQIFGDFKSACLEEEENDED